MNKKIIQYILFALTIPADLAYLLSKEKIIIQRDIKRIISDDIYQSYGLRALNYSLLHNKPFRSVFYYRIRDMKLLRLFSRLLLKELPSIEIYGRIDAGFRVSHGYCVVHPYSAGANLTVNQGVTIGSGKPNSCDETIVNPIIGDNVTIYTNAVVFGGINIGNNVLIGAGTIVNKDIPDNCTVVGNPCRIISK